VGCSAAADPTANGELGDPLPSPGQPGVGGAKIEFGGTGGGINIGTAGGQPIDECGSSPTSDQDQDGYAIVDGDCNDCNPTANPGAIEVITDPNDPAAVAVDEDCDGLVDEPHESCDVGLWLHDTDPIHAAHAMEICQLVGPDGKGWGLVNAAYVRASGTPFPVGPNVGLVDSFGPHVQVRKGDRMLALSSGHARAPGQDAAANTDSLFGHGLGMAPPGFPQDVPGCMGAPVINDDIGLQLELRAPTNATGYSFEFTFYSFEFPEYVCTPFNDQFIALVAPPPAGSINGNISFDSKTNPVSVNIAMFDVCEPSSIGQFAQHCAFACPAPPNPYCPLGPFELVSTGFQGEWANNQGGATGWLVTTAPVTGGEQIVIRLAIWDTGDQILDSTVLVDNFAWLADPGSNVTVSTVPVPK